MRTRSSRVTPRLGAAVVLAFAGPLAAIAALAPADAASTSAVVSEAGPAQMSVHVHTWVETPAQHAASAPRPTGTWIDGIHGPALDGVLLSTPTLVALLVGLAVVAVMMANRAGRMGKTNGATDIPSAPIDRERPAAAPTLPVNEGR